MHVTLLPPSTWRAEVTLFARSDKWRFKRTGPLSLAQVRRRGNTKELIYTSGILRTCHHIFHIFLLRKFCSRLLVNNLVQIRLVTNEEHGDMFVLVAYILNPL